VSTFDVKIRKLDRVDPHPNADRLELAVIGGYRSVVQKGTHKEGDLILYLQEDTVFRDLSIAEKLKVTTYLTGSAKNRVKAIRLRGALSQGIVVPLHAIEDTLASLGFGYYEFREGMDFAEELLVEKYEEPIPLNMTGRARQWPSFLPKYEVENVKRPESMELVKAAAEVHDDFVVTEKLHGTNVAFAWGPGLEDGEGIYVCSRNRALKEDEDNVYWRAAREYKIPEIVEQVLIDNRGHFDSTRLESFSIHGEIVGVQDLKYGCVNGEVKFYAFDIMYNGHFIDYDRFVHICHHYNIPRVPELFRGKFDYEKIAALVEGKTLVEGGHIREGGVCKQTVERMLPFSPRVVLKFVSEDYLTRKGGTELK
jgi:RNA ligase (TIGR02306 family)